MLCIFPGKDYYFNGFCGPVFFLSGNQASRFLPYYKKKKKQKTFTYFWRRVLSNVLVVILPLRHPCTQ